VGTLVHSQERTCEIFVERSGTGASFYLEYFGFILLIVIPPMVHSLHHLGPEQKAYEHSTDRDFNPDTCRMKEEETETDLPCIASVQNILASSVLA
jgi:hypothetical protein